MKDREQKEIKKKLQKPLSLYPLSFEDALNTILRAKPRNKKEEKGQREEERKKG